MPVVTFNDVLTEAAIVGLNGATWANAGLNVSAAECNG